MLSPILTRKFLSISVPILWVCSKLHKIFPGMTQLYCLAVTQNDMKEVVRKLIADSYAKKVENVLKKPRFDLSKLLETHGDDGGGKTGTGEDGGERTEKADGYEPPVVETV